jgi:ABC-2 type transport system permease protein
VFACAAAVLLVVTALVTTGASLPAARWVELGAALLAGIVPFAFLGIALGYWAPAKGALPIANLLYLVMSYVGGLWILPARLPDDVGSVSRFLPTRALADELVATAAGAPVDWGAWCALAGFAALFAWIAVAGYRRDEGKRFS